MSDGEKPAIAPGERPPWMRARAISFDIYDSMKHTLGSLHTVCESARCPNLGECWKSGTATFMIMGDICTRSCKFCAISTGRPRPLDPDEPARLAEAAREMKLRHVPQLHRMRQLIADFRRQRLQCLQCLGGAILQQHGDEHLGMRHVAGDFDVGDAGRGQAVLAHGFVDQGAQLPAQLRRDPVRAME